jgi:hypothetical protein
MQSYEKSVMHKGVLRDIERQKAKKSMAVAGAKESKGSSLNEPDILSSQSR